MKINVLGGRYVELNGRIVAPFSQEQDLQTEGYGFQPHQRRLFH